MVCVLRRIGLVTLMAGAAAFLATAAQADAMPKGNAKAGAQIFKQCAICHSDAKGAPNKIGPNLWGIVGSRAGTVPGFNFSAAMKKAGQSGLIWNNHELEEYVEHPQKVVPGNKMPFAGLPSEKQAADVVAYLDTLK